MRAVYLLGPPASGKSTVMAELLNQLGLVTGDWFKVWPDQHGEFRAEHLEDIVTGTRHGLYLGRTRPGFPGTDAIGLASHSEAVRWAENAEELPDLVLGEGARLGTAKFLSALHARGRLTVACLTAPEAELDARCEARGSSQKAQFRKGAATRAGRAADALELAGVEVLRFDTTEWTPAEVAEKLARYAVRV